MSNKSTSSFPRKEWGNRSVKISQEKTANELTAHFFRNEYGKLVSVIARYLGNEHIETAEDIVQETLLKATEHWKIKGIPENPRAWLYTTAKNHTLNILKHQKHQREYASSINIKPDFAETNLFSESAINDGQLRMMFACCHPTISQDSQIALVLKILSGFSIVEIADAFFSNVETINKRLVRGRKKLRLFNFNLEHISDWEKRAEAVLKTIYLIFNEGYFPSNKNQVIRFDLCLEAIRLTTILLKSSLIIKKAECHELLALMYFNASRFTARVSEEETTIDLKEQDRSKWNQQLIQKGMWHLDWVTQSPYASKYGILATISAHHCLAKTYKETDWAQILSLYDQLLKLEDSPIVHLNRCVVMAEAKDAKTAIESLENLQINSDISSYYLYHFTLAEILKKDGNLSKAKASYLRALKLTKNTRDKRLLKKKLDKLVLILPSRLS